MSYSHRHRRPDTQEHRRFVPHHHAHPAHTIVADCDEAMTRAVNTVKSGGRVIVCAAFPTVRVVSINPQQQVA